MRPLRVTIALASMLLVLAACSSGPSPATLAAGRIPTTTTTTEPPPEGVVVVRITNGSFRPSNLDVDITSTPIVEWRHEDLEERVYQISSTTGEFESEPLSTGDVFQVDFSNFPPGIYRYFSFLGNTRIPGTVDTRPAQ